MSVVERPFDASPDLLRMPNSAEHLRHALANLAVASEFLKAGENPDNPEHAIAVSRQIQQLLSSLDNGLEISDSTNAPAIEITDDPQPSSTETPPVSPTEGITQASPPEMVADAPKQEPEHIDQPAPTLPVSVSEQPTQAPVEVADASPLVATHSSTQQAPLTPEITAPVEKNDFTERLREAVRDIVSGQQPAFVKGGQVDLHQFSAAMGLTRQELQRIVTDKAQDHFAQGFEVLGDKAPAFKLVAPDAVVPPNSTQEYHLQKAHLRFLNLLHITAPFGYVTHEDMAWLFNLKKTGVASSLSMMKRLPVYGAVVAVKDGHRNVGLRGKTVKDIGASMASSSTEQTNSAPATEEKQAEPSSAQPLKRTPTREVKTPEPASKEYLRLDGSWDTQRLKRFLGDGEASDAKLAHFLGSQLIHHNSTPDKDGDVLQIIPRRDRNCISIFGSPVNVSDDEMRILNLLILSPDSTFDLHQAVDAKLFGERATFESARRTLLDLVGKVHSVVVATVFVIEPEDGKYWVRTNLPVRTKEPSFGRDYVTLKRTSETGFLEVAQ